MNDEFDEADQLVSPDHGGLLFIVAQPKVRGRSILRSPDRLRAVWAISTAAQVYGGMKNMTNADLVLLISSSVQSVTETVAVIVIYRLKGVVVHWMHAVTVCIVSQPKHKSTLHLSVNGHIGTASASI